MSAATHGGQLIRKWVTLEEVLHHFSTTDSRATGGSFGNALERARDGTTGGGDIKRRQEQQERKMMADAAVLRCVEDLERHANFSRDVPSRTLGIFAAASQRPEGWVVCRILEAYEPWAYHQVSSGPNMQESNRGLIEVYRWARRIDPSMRDIDSGELHKRWSERPAELLADAHLAVGEFVKRWRGRTP